LPISLILILVLTLAGVASAATFAIALGRAAAQGDEEMSQLLVEGLPDAIARRRETYAGFARAQPTISLEPSITVPSSSISVGTQRLPVSSWTSLRPRVWLNIPGNGANP
jgi:hypothetical protein